MKAGESHDISFIRQDGSTEVGLMLAWKRDSQGNKLYPLYQEYDDPALANQIYSGEPDYAHLPPEKEVQLAQDDWRSGMGQEVYDSDDPKRYYDSYNMDLRFSGQAVASPAVSSLTQPSGVTRAFCEFNDLLYVGIDDMLCKLGASSSTMTLRPNAAGSETSIGNQYPNATSHYDKVDDTTADDASTYVSNETNSYQRDLYNLPASGGSGTINFIKIYFRCKADMALFAKPSLKSDSTVTDGTEIILTSSWITYSQQWATNPADSAAWEWADIDALEIGVSLRGTGGGLWESAYCTQVYVEINYTTTTDEIALVHDFADGKNITDLEAFTDGNLYIARGGANKYSYMDTGENITESALADGKADYFQTVDTTLWKAVKARELKSATDPTDAGSWSVATNVGSTAHNIMGLLEESGQLYVMKEDMPYYLDTSGNVHRLIPELKSLETSTSGENSDVWQAKLYIPCGAQSLVEYDGGAVSWRSPAAFFICTTNVTDYIGRVMALAHDEEWLFAITQAISGAGSIPKVFAGRLETIEGDTQWVWHSIASPTLGTTGICQTAFASTVYKKRLYLASTATTTSLEYIPLPTTYSNVDADPDYTTVSDGYFITPFLHANFKADSKAYIKLTLGLDNVDTNNYFETHYQLKGTTTWTDIGDFKTEPTTAQYIPVDASSNNPSGTMIRFKFIAKVTDTSTSPRLLSYDCRGIWYPARRNIIACTVRCADKITLKGGHGVDTQTAETIKEAIEEARDDATYPVTFYDIEGDTSYVKFLSAKSYLIRAEKDREAERVYDLVLQKVALS